MSIVNRNRVISYGCLRNISCIISYSNRIILPPKQQPFGSNCRIENECPPNGECQTPSVIHRADVVNKSENQNRDFKHQKYGNDTKLVKYIWQLKHNNISFSVKWTIITKVYGSPNPLLWKFTLASSLFLLFRCFFASIFSCYFLMSMREKG